MDPMTRKRKLVLEHAKDQEIKRLRKKLVAETHNHYFHKCLNSNNQKFLQLLIRTVKKKVPENIRKEMHECMCDEFIAFSNANKKLKEQYNEFLKNN
jgi:hypothetical protein